MWKVGAWRSKKESKTIHHRNENNTRSKSDNTNSTIEGDDINVTLNLQNIFNMDGHAGNTSNQAAESPSELHTQSDNTNNANPSPSATSSDKGNHAQSTTSINQPEEPPMSTLSKAGETGRERLYSSESVGQSLFSDSEYPVPKEIMPGNMRKHLPKNTEDYIQAYMSNSTLFGSNVMIPLWKPSPSNESDSRTWGRYAYLGDVGIFNAEGGFDTLFNIFDSRACNQERGYEPPEDFIPYPKSLKELRLKLERTKLPTANGLKMVGFEAVSQPKRSHSNATNPSYQANASNCSAICLRTGFLEANITQWERPRILEYIRDHQESWQRHVEKTSGTHFSDRPLVVIFTTWRTQNFALVAGSRPWPRKCQGIITLRKSVEEGRTYYEWEVAGDNHIFTQFGPSPQLLQNQESYFKAMETAEHPRYSQTTRKEVEECHCVAIGAFALRKRGRILGGSVKSGRSNRTIRPDWGRMSMPTHLDSIIQEEVEF